MPKEALAVLGLPAIGIVLRRDPALAPRDLRLRLDGDARSEDVVGLPAGSIVVRSSALHVGARFQVEAEPWPDPANPRRRAALIRGTRVDAVDPALGAMALDPVGAALVAIGAWVQRIGERTIDVGVSARLLSQLPSHDAAALLARCGIDAVTAVLTALVAEGVPLRSLPEFAPLLATRIACRGSGPAS